MNELIKTEVMTGHDGTYKGKITVYRITPEHQEEKIYSLFAIPLRITREDALQDAELLKTDLLTEKG